jgi:hypothetical protein
MLLPARPARETPDRCGFDPFDLPAHVVRGTQAGLDYMAILPKHAPACAPQRESPRQEWVIFFENGAVQVCSSLHVVRECIRS